MAANPLCSDSGSSGKQYDDPSPEMLGQSMMVGEHVLQPGTSSRLSPTPQTSAAHVSLFESLIDQQIDPLDSEAMDSHLRQTMSVLGSMQGRVDLSRSYETHPHLTAAAAAAAATAAAAHANAQQQGTSGLQGGVNGNGFPGARQGATGPMMPSVYPVNVELYPAAGFTPATPFLLPPQYSQQFTTCLLAAQASQPVTCTCRFSHPGQQCTMHHAPIAYGQASSSFQQQVQSNQQAQQQQLQNQQQGVQQIQQTMPSGGVQHSQQQNHQQTIQNQPPPSQQQQQMRVGMPPVQCPAPIPSTLPPTLPQSMRSMTMRLKRPAAMQSGARVSSGAPKLRRMGSTTGNNGNNQQQVVQEHPQQQPGHGADHPPSTSQLPPGVPPCVCGPPSRGTGCGQCMPCHYCHYCPMQALPHPPCTHQHASVAPPSAAPQQQPVPPVQQVQRNNNPNTLMDYARLRAASDALWSSSLASLDAAMQHQAAQRQQMPPFIRPFPLPGSTSVYILPRNGMPAAVVNNVNGRMFELNMLVNVVPHELFLNGERPPVLERHHVFGAPVSEPPPIGASLADIEKNTCRSEFVKDIEVPENEKERCTVCLMDFETGEGVRTLKCSHLFHVDCIDRWLVYNKKCPVCRLDVDQNLAVLVEE